MKPPAAQGLTKLVSDYFPMAIASALTGFLLWSFALSPYVSTAMSNLQEEQQQHSGGAAAAARASSHSRHPLSSTAARTAVNPGGMTHATDFMPESTELSWLLNKTLAIDPLLVVVNGAVNPRFVLGDKISDWDERRRQHQEQHQQSSTESAAGSNKVLLVSGSQPGPCLNTLGDHLMLKSLKNKIDYARLHNLDLFYNMATFTANLPSWWVKLPLLRSLMLSRPDVEWLWWADSDAVLTDMSFLPPFERYEGKNLIIHGWDHLVYEQRRWTGLNMGVFLVRNCQWTLDLFDELAPMGFAGEIGDRIGKILTLSLSGRPENFESDDQGAFIYLLNAQRDRWGPGVLLENSYHLNGYWKDIVERFELLQRDSKPGFGDERWPLMTHFTGCQICSGVINSVYRPDECRSQMQRALAFADDQVLRHLGYAHVALSTSDIVRTNASSPPQPTN